MLKVRKNAKCILEAYDDYINEEQIRRAMRAWKDGMRYDLRSDLCSLTAAPLAQKLYPLLLKILFTQASEPYQMKGGTLIFAHKSGDRSQPENFRGLLLSSHIGKSIRRTFRQQLVPHYQSWASDTHFSIKLGGNVSQASHALRLFVAGSVRRGNSVGVLFLDIRSAYYRVVRQLMTGRTPKAESIARMMQYFDLGDTDPQALFRTIAERAQDHAHDIDRQREILLEEMMDSTWFTSRHRTTLVESLAGTRPGDGLADIVFGLVFHRITQRITERLSEEMGIGGHVVTGQFDLFAEEGAGPGDYNMPELIDVVWADDLAMAWRSPTAAGLADGMRKITSYRKFRKQLFQNKLLSLGKRIYLFKSMVLSVLHCGGLRRPMVQGEGSWRHSWPFSWGWRTTAP